MHVVEESIVINKPRSEVFAFAADSAHYLDWVTTVIQFEATPPGPFQADTTAKGVNRTAGRNLEWTAKMAEYEDGAVIGFEAVEAAVPFKYAYRFEDHSEGTRVTFRAEVSTLGGLFGKLAEPVVVRMYSHGVKANLANLKELLEA
jgi:uncharacterized membrane protein